MRLKLWQQILLAMVAGIAVGLLAGPGVLTEEILKPLGHMFIGLIKMLVVPLIFCSLIAGVASMEGDLQRMGRISGRTFLLYMITTAIAVTLGLAVATLLAPGQGVSLDLNVAKEAVKAEAPQSLLSYLTKTLQELVPSNPVKALTEGNILQIIIFALLFAVAMNKVGEKGKPVREFFVSAAEVVYALTAMVMKVAPLGIFALLAWVAGSHGLKILGPLFKLILCCYLASLLHLLLVIGGGARWLAKIPLRKFFSATSEPLAFAFASTSSSGTLPLTINAVHNNLGVSRRLCEFMLPLGATINMDGTAIYQGVCAVFIAQLYGVDLSSSHYLAIIFTATLASIGTAGIPGAGLIMLSMVLTAANLPLEAIALIGGVDRILDMARTVVNIMGDCMVTTVVARQEQELDYSKIKE